MGHACVTDDVKYQGFTKTLKDVTLELGKEGGGRTSQINHTFEDIKYFWPWLRSYRGSKSFLVSYTLYAIIIWDAPLDNLSGVSNKVRFKPACSATETSTSNSEISSVVSLDMILSNKQITKTLYSDWFSRWGPSSLGPYCLQYKLPKYISIGESSKFPKSWT